MTKEERTACFELFLLLANGELELQQAERLSSKIFLEFCRFHRIVPEVYQLLTCLPEKYTVQAKKALEQLKYFYYQNVHTSVRMRNSLLELANNFNGQHIRWLAFKGTVLSQLLYGNDYSRQFKDIDIFVNKDQVDAAEEILLGLGYKKIGPVLNLSALQQKLYRHLNKDYSYYHPLTKVNIELHWNLSIVLPEKNPLVTAEKQKVTIDGVEIPTLSQAQLFIYLCIHGGFSFWALLHWLLDVRAFILKYGDTLDWENVLKMATELGVDRCVGQAFYLLNCFFKMAIPRPIDVYLKKEKRIPLLANYIIKEYEELMIRNNYFLQHFRYKFLASSKFLVKIRCFYHFLAFPFTSSKNYFYKKRKFAMLYFLIAFPISMINGMVKRNYIEGKKHVGKLLGRSKEIY